MNIEQLWPEWQTERMIGKGSFGTVYKCYKLSDDGGKEYSAVKVISVPQDDFEAEEIDPDGSNPELTRTYYKDIVDSFVNEIKILESLKGHKNIVEIQDSRIVEKENGIGWQIFIRMELLTDFNTYASDKKLTEADVRRLALDISEALIACGEKKILHRDIKGENIFVCDDGTFKLGDFGVAKQLESTSSSMSIKGALNYIAPEVLKAEKYDSRADIYSLGLVMYKTLNNNRLPFLDPDKQLIKYSERQEAFEKRIRGDKIPPIPGVDDKLNSIILKACEFRPEDRFSDFTEFKKALLGGKTSRSAKKKIIIPLIAIVLAIAVAVPSILYFGGKKKDSPVNPAATTQEITPLTCAAGEVISFGSYPQSEVTDENLISKLDKLEKEWISYGFSYGNDDYQGEIHTSDYMRYADIELDGKKYRAVTFDYYRPTSIFGRLSKEWFENVEDCDEPVITSYQGEEFFNTDTVYYFLYEPVEWTVVDPQKGLVNSCKALDARPFSDICGDNVNNYSESYIRQWLNGEFYDTAFSDSEKEKIQTAEYKYLSDGAVNDRISLLSYDDYLNPDYSFSSSGSTGLNLHVFAMKTGTDYARCCGLESDTDSNSTTADNCCWMLSSRYMHSGNSNTISVIDFSGNYFEGFCSDTGLGIAPVCRLKGDIKSE